MAAYVANLLFSNVYCMETKKKTTRCVSCRHGVAPQKKNPPLDAYHVVMVLVHWTVLEGQYQLSWKMLS